MPFDRDVTIDFNADISGYSASMGQMIQQTSQYSAAADGMIGKIGKMNNVIMAGVKSMSAFTNTNKVATAQAAAYQQQLSKIETSAKVNNKSFKELEKTTKGLAKDFPIGMKQAVEQVESLQEAGVTSNKEISQLAKTFTKLGAATGTFGPELGKNMLQLNRTFENGTDNMEKYADSLTTVTHAYGANAGAVTAFAKSIAPVAATVGMNETSVIGLSTAFSRLGEDGYAAANTFNKVMLDMSKSIREGTPEAKIYAEVMGTTSDNLKQAWESNPAEGFIDFVEAIKKQGQGGIRSLEQLGLEGVRTQKTIMSLANSGNMREIVQKAQSAYGSGATGGAAETAMGGVNDQLTMLNETMAQTTATAGKPFLSFLEKVLGVANSLSKVLSSLVESDAIQGLAKAVGIAGGAWGLSKMMNSSALMGSMLLSGGKGIARSGPWQGFSMGRAGTQLMPGEAPSLGYRAGNLVSGLFGGAGAGGPWYQGPMATAKRGTNFLGNAMGMYYNANASQVLRSLDREGISTPEGEKARAALRNVNLIRKDTGITDEGVRRSAMKEAGKDAGRQFNAMMNQAGGATNALKGWTNQLKASGAFWKSIGGSAARGGVNALGSLGGMVGLSGTAAVGAGAVGLAAGAGYMYYQGEKKEKEGRERGGKDAYRMYNEFAEKAGIATKGLVSFAEAVSESTSAIASESKTREDAYILKDKERLQASSASYERAYDTRGGGFMGKLTNWNGADPMKEAVRIRGMLGPNASPEAINRIQMDLVNQMGETFANQVMTNYSGVEKLSSTDLEKLLREKGDKSRTMGLVGNTESAEFQEMAQAEAARREKRDIDIKGFDATKAGKLKGGESAMSRFQELEAQFGKEGVDETERYEQAEAALEQAADELGITDEGDRRKFKRSAKAAQMNGKYIEGKTFADVLEGGGMETDAAHYRTQMAAGGVVQKAGGFKNLTDTQVQAMSVSQSEQLAQDSVNNMKDLGVATGTLATDMAGTNKIIRDSKMTFDEWQEAGQAGANELQKAYADVKASPGDVNAQSRLANLVAEKAIADAKKQGGGTAAAKQIVTSAMTSETGEEIPALKQAQAILDQRAATTDSGISTWEKTGTTITTGLTAQKALEGPEAEKLTTGQREQFEAEKAAGIQAQQQREAQVRQFQLAMTRQQEDFNKSRLRMNRDYEQQMGYQAEDYAKQRKYMISDYHKGVRRAEEDFYTQRHRAQRDFNKQMKRQSEETAKNMFDPYQRIAPQFVSDMDVLQQNLIDQNRNIGSQLKGVSKLGKMGLSKDAIDQLKLMDPGQNQQVQRLLADAQQNPSSIAELNKIIAQRLKMGKGLATSEYNKQYTDAQKDFAQSMDDMADDFKKNMKRGEKDFKTSLSRNADAFATAQGRAATAHQTALSDMDADNKQAITRAQEDLTGMASEFTDSYVDVQTKFLQDLASMPGNMAPATKDAIKAVLEAEAKAIEEANTKASSAGKTKSEELNDLYGGGGEGGHDLEGVDGPTAGKGHYSGNWRNYSSGKFHGGADIAAPLGTPTYAVTEGRVKYTKRLKTSYGIHALVTDGRHDFLYGHMSALTVNAGDRVSPGTQIGRVGSTGNSTGNHLHFEVRPAGAGHNSAISPHPWLADGGIAVAHTMAHVGESGPEAVVPLNDQGMKFLSDAMTKAARYWQPAAASGTRSQGYSSPVTNNVYSYDQRTQFMGEVKVESQDPEEMARKLRARERRNRLARKTGSAA